MDWFAIDFDKFTEEENIKNNPSLGISYRLRDPSLIHSGDELARTYDLISKGELSPDLEFIHVLNDRLKRISDGNKGEFYFKLKLATIPLGPLNNLGNFLYAYLGTTEQLHQNDINSKKASKLIDNIGSETILLSVRIEKKPLELKFNYNFCKLQEENQGDLYTNLRGNNLNDFIKSLSSESL
jgi:hypothetical protein